MVEDRAVVEVQPDGTLCCAGARFRCALGKAGITTAKREGDGATPAGRFPLRRLLYRADRMAAPPGPLASSALSRTDGWCDDSRHPDYNRLVTLPHPGRCERLWRRDPVYDLIVPLGYNDDPPRAGRGSAIFLHVARRDYAPTRGCVALALPDLLTLLTLLPPEPVIEIAAPGHC